VNMVRSPSCNLSAGQPDATCRQRTKSASWPKRLLHCWHHLHFLGAPTL